MINTVIQHINAKTRNKKQKHTKEHKNTKQKKLLARNITDSAQ